MTDEDDTLSTYSKPAAFLDGSLIDVTGSWTEVADLSFGEAYHYREGYRRAARAVIDTTGETTYDADQLVYPLVVLYRHCLELHLKHLVGYLPRPIETHNLASLWKAVRELLSQEIGVPTEELNVVESRIMELHDLDERATAFRYAYKRESEGGGKSLTEGGLNLKLFAQRTESLCEVLDNWDTAIHEQRNWRAEMDDYYRDEYGP